MRLWSHATRFAATAMALACLATASLAHSPLTSTTPANGASVAAAPTVLVLNFKGAIRLTRVRITVNGSAQDIDLSDFKAFQTEFQLPLGATTSGPHQIEWRGLGEDGHAQKGTFSYTVK